MATLLEEFNALKIRVSIAQAKGDTAALNRKIHIIDHEAERERKRTNPTKSTRVMLNCRTPEQWKEFQMAKERYFELASDPHIAIDLMVWALNHIDDAAIRAKLEAGHAQPGDHVAPGPPRAEIPDWLKT